MNLTANYTDPCGGEHRRAPAELKRHDDEPVCSPTEKYVQSG
jgi:hypothetical protein